MHHISNRSPSVRPHSHFSLCGAGGMGGLIFLILLFSVVIVYFVGFALFNKFKNGAEGSTLLFESTSQLSSLL